MTCVLGFECLTANQLPNMLAICRLLHGMGKLHLSTIVTAECFIGQSCSQKKCLVLLSAVTQLQYAYKAEQPEVNYLALSPCRCKVSDTGNADTGSLSAVLSCGHLCSSGDAGKSLSS